MRERKLEEEFGRIRRERGENPLQGFFFFLPKDSRAEIQKTPARAFFPNRHPVTSGVSKNRKGNIPRGVPWGLGTS